MSSAGVHTSTIAVPYADAALARAAAASMARFYPTVDIQIAGDAVRLSSSQMSERQLRTAWLCHVLEAKRGESSSRAREGILQELFS